MCIFSLMDFTRITPDKPAAHWSGGTYRRKSTGVFNKAFTITRPLLDNAAGLGYTNDTKAKPGRSEEDPAFAGNPTGSGYRWCLHEIRLLDKAEYAKAAK
jgi:hypothetical protein